MKKYILFGLVSLDSVYVHKPIWQPIDSFDTTEEAVAASSKIEIRGYQYWYGHVRIYSKSTFVQENLAA